MHRNIVGVRVLGTSLMSAVCLVVEEEFFINCLLLPNALHILLFWPKYMTCMRCKRLGNVKLVHSCCLFTPSSTVA